MNKTSKIVVAAVLVICVLAAAYFIIFRPEGAKPPDPAATDTPTGTTEVTDTPGPSETAGPVETDPGEESTPPAPEPAGTLQELTMPGDTVLRFWIDEDAYEHGGSFEGDIYVEKAVPNSESRLEIILMEGTPEAHRPNFLEGYFASATEMNIDGINYIPGTEIAGEQVTATDGTRSAEAWLVDVGTGTLAVVICYTTEAQADAYYKVLGSMELVEL